MELEFPLLQPVINVSCHCKSTLLTHIQIVVCHIPRSFSAGLLLSQLVSSLYLFVRLSCSRCRTLYLLLLIYIKHFYQSFAPPCKGYCEW